MCTGLKSKVIVILTDKVERSLIHKPDHHTEFIYITVTESVQEEENVQEEEPMEEGTVQKDEQFGFSSGEELLREFLGE